MTKLKIYEYPDHVLREETRTITEFDDGLKRLVEDMAETMWDAPGVGLAAPQVGKSLKLVVVDFSRQSGKEEDCMPLINPEIIEHEGSQVDEEGCLSVPELFANVTRAQKVTVRYQDLEGKVLQLSAEDRFAVVLQHEIDHINGVLFLDHLSRLKRNLYKKKVKKRAKVEQHA